VIHPCCSRRPEGREERSGFDDEGPVGDLFDAGGDADSVHGGKL